MTKKIKEKGTSVFVVIQEPLLLAGIVNIVLGSNDLFLLGKSSDRIDIINVINKLRPTILIVDIDLFDDPFEVIKSLRRSNPKLSILLMTSSITPGWCLRYISIGVAGCLLKKASATEILNSIRCVNTGEFVIDLRIGCELAYYLQQSLDDPQHFRNPDNLTPKELGVLKLAGQGLTNRAIATKLFISERTVQNHFASIFTKLSVRSRTEAISEAWRKRLLTNTSVE